VVQICVAYCSAYFLGGYFIMAHTGLIRCPRQSLCTKAVTSPYPIAESSCIMFFPSNLLKVEDASEVDALIRMFP
jgi:hypothetical protein